MKKKQVNKGIVSEESNNQESDYKNNRYDKKIYVDSKESSSSIPEKNRKFKYNDDDKNEESETPSSQQVLRFVDIRNIKGSKLEISASDVKSFERSKLAGEQRKKAYKLKSSYNTFKATYFNNKKDPLKLSQVSQISTMRNKKAKKAPLKGDC